MERIVQEAFITLPIFRSQPASQTQKKQSLILKQKLTNIIKSFNDRELLAQAIKNIGIPKTFVDLNYIETRSEDEMSKIYLALCTLRKEVERIKRHSASNDINFNVITMQSKKKIEQQRAKSKSKQRPLIIFKSEIQEDLKIKNALQRQIQFRQRMQKMQIRAIQSQKIKKELVQKKKQTAKNLNKKANEVYEKQKLKQENMFQQIRKTVVCEENNQNKQSQSKVTLFRTFTSSNMRQRHQQFLKEKLQHDKVQFQKYFHQQEIKRRQKDFSYKQFKHKRLNSLNQRMINRETKTQQIRQRKIMNSLQQENEKIKRLIEKELKIMNNKSPKTLLQVNRISETIQTSANLTNTKLNFLNTVQYSPSVNKQSLMSDDKQNTILQKIQQKNERRQFLLNMKVDMVREKLHQQQLRRANKKEENNKYVCKQLNSQIGDESIINNSFSEKKLYKMSPSLQQKNIKKKHRQLLRDISCDENIEKLKKLPKCVLEKKLKKIKEKELSLFISKNLLQLFA